MTRFFGSTIDVDANMLHVKVTVVSFVCLFTLKKTDSLMSQFVSACER